MKCAPKNNGKFKAYYKYISPGPAGPFKGTVQTDDKVSKGEHFYWAFGLVEVIKIVAKR